MTGPTKEVQNKTASTFKDGHRWGDSQTLISLKAQFRLKCEAEVIFQNRSMENNSAASMPL